MLLQVSPFNPDIIEHVDFYKGGFPPKYGGRLSSVVDIHTLDGGFDKCRGGISIGLLDGRIHFDGPIVKSKLSCSISARRSWLDLLTGPILGIVNSNRGDNLSGLYNFYDLNAKLAYKLSSQDRITFSFYTGYDRLNGGDVRDDIEIRSSDKFKFKWGNSASCLNFKHTSSSGLSSFNTDIFYSTSSSVIDLENDKMPYKAEKEHDRHSYFEHTYHKVENLGISFHGQYMPSANHSFRFGASVIKYHFLNEGDAQIDSVSTAAKVLSKSKELSAYFEHRMTLFKNFTSSSGVRLAFSEGGGKKYSRIEPRLSIIYELSPTLTSKASYTVMTQSNHLVSSSYLDLPTNMWMPSTKSVKPMISRQIVFGVCKAFFHNLDINIDGWWKTMTGLLLYDGIDSFFPRMENWDSRFYKGIGKSYGIEMSADWNVNEIYASAGYTISWSKRRFDEIYYDWFYDHLDSRNKISFSVKWSPNEHFDFSANWNYHTGFRFTMPTHVMISDSMMESGLNNSDFPPKYEALYSTPNNVLLPGYHRLDVGCNFRKKFDSRRERVWNLSVYNVYCRLNPLFMVPEEQQPGKYIGKAYAVIPILPSVGYSFRF